MKHIVIGEINGRDNWQEINIRNYEKVVFIGDYVDSFELSDFTILENLKKIIRRPQNATCFHQNRGLLPEPNTCLFKAIFQKINSKSLSPSQLKY